MHNLLKFQYHHHYVHMEIEYHMLRTGINKMKSTNTFEKLLTNSIEFK